MREFFSLDNPKNAETNDDDDQPGADESDSQVTNSDTVEFEKNWLLVSYTMYLSRSGSQLFQYFAF